MGRTKRSKIVYILFFLVMVYPIFGSFAKDTDIYELSVRQNSYILMDNSGSMDFGVYEHTIDYGEMFRYLYCLDENGGDTACGDQYIYDTVNHSSYFYYNQQERRKIYLLKGDIGLTIANVDGETTAFTGDPANPNYLWDIGNMVDTHTMIDQNGDLTGDGTGNQRLTVNSDGYVRLDGQPLPLGQDIKLHEFKELYDGSVIDDGLGGLLNAPGYYFSGYEGVAENNLNTAEHGDSGIYFFTTGNWINMQSMYNLHYVTNNPNPKGAATGDPAWKYETVPIEASSWSLLSYNLDYPEGSGNYASDLSEIDTEQTITQPGAAQMQVHFSDFDVDGDGDYVVLKDQGGNNVATYDNLSNPTNDDGWSATVEGDTVRICLSSDSDANTGTGYTINRIRVTYQSGGAYLMQNRMDVAKDAMLYTLDEFYGKMNWGYATFQGDDGAQFGHSLNPNENDDVNTNSIKNAVEKVSANGPTPLGEALQDVFEKGYHNNSSALDNLLCRKNYVISLSDGFPSADNDWDRMGPQISDADGDGWTADPYQYNNPPANYYDDVAHWMYTHSWRDKSEVSDPANSYENIITHHIAFGANHPLMKDAAGESGGEYVTAYNKSQLIAAFYAIGLQITDAVSFTAPVVSVDAANKIQNGDNLYLGLFIPQDNKAWQGNLKQFRFGNQEGEDPWKVYDGGDNLAVNSQGEFLDNTNGFWGDENDENDSDDYGAADVTEDGVGEVLKERIEDDFTSGTYYERNIKTFDDALGLVDIENATTEDLDVGTLQARNELVNYLYGYTNQADATNGGAPQATRGWVLGSIIHSRPVVIDYYDANGALDERYIAVGANDGMLHVFDDTTGQEELAFIPPDILTKLKELPQKNMVETVDGRVRLYRKNNTPKYLIFGERRGGGNYWCLDIENSDPANWEVEWVYDNPEISQSWSEPKFATIPTGIDPSTGEHTFEDVMIVTGGYDAEEDNYPEPFEDIDNSGSPFNDNGTIDNKEWSQSNGDQDINGNNQYDLYNPDKNENGRGIFIVDIDNPETEYYAASYDTDPTMKWCFPASPNVVTGTYKYKVKQNGSLHTKHESNFLRAVYATDIYANVYKIRLNFESQYDEAADSFSAVPSPANRWSVNEVFSGNPSSIGNSVTSDGEFEQGMDATEVQGYKAFYSPAVSWGGACDFFDKSNYRFRNTTFHGTGDIASIYFGTGDREHPTYTMKKNRFYAVYDDSSVTAEDENDNPVTVSTAPYKEANLVNLSCDELDDDTILTGSLTKGDYRIALTDDPYYHDNATIELENGSNEDDAKGWYIVLADQGDAGKCSHCDYAADFADEDHDWEKVLSKVQLFAGNLYFTTYQPDISDICNPKGNGFSYSLNYCDATAAYDLNPFNSDSSDVTDRYNKVNNIFGIPSGYSIVVRNGEAGAMAMMGGKMTGPKGGDDYEIDAPETGLDLFYWLEGNTN